MAQSATAQSHSSHGPAIDMVAPPHLAIMKPQQTLAASPQQPPNVAGTTVPPTGPAAGTITLTSPVVVPSQGLVARSSHLHSAAT
ncbi:hypothetical protein L3X38_011582 [Prunus dulcis]|uniref:Uncharacterized protein n=1 Tax=Prunus dulcis TaxID=3755 RepID=A0AAD4WID6_PRUDU|nr:hypothetical protein L3X38_011582 [Prunus dulcis]